MSKKPSETPDVLFFDVGRKLLVEADQLIKTGWFAWESERDPTWKWATGCMSDPALSIEIS